MHVDVHVKWIFQAVSKVEASVRALSAQDRSKLLSPCLLCLRVPAQVESAGGQYVLF